MRYFLICSIFITGCICLNPDHKKSGPPIANTGEVISSLEKTKTELEKAGDSNTLVGEKVDKALTLAGRLEKLLEQIEQSELKTVKDPIK
jgi:hypothetical protein